jgi:hypothetical protein
MVRVPNGDFLLQLRFSFNQIARLDTKLKLFFIPFFSFACCSLFPVI